MLGSTGELWEEFGSNPTILACDLCYFTGSKKGKTKKA